MNKTVDFSSIPKANWINVLPDLHNKKVLKIGTDSIDIIKLIFNCNVASLSCIGTPREELQNVVSKYYHSEENIAERFDIVIFNNVSPIDSINNISDYLYKIKDLLNEAGVLLVCCPDGWGNLKYRYTIRKALQNGSKGNLKYYICNPSSATPYSIIPYINDKIWLTYNYPNIEEESFYPKIILKGKVKEYIFSILRKYNPLCGLIIVLDKAGNMNNAHDEYKLSNANEFIDYGPKEKDPLVNISIAYHWSSKHYLFSYGQFDKKLRHMKKIEFNPSEHGNHLEKEYNNLNLFKEYIDVYEDCGIVIPHAVYFNKLSDRHESSMTVVKGMSLKYLVDKSMYQKNINNVIDLLTQATDMQICFQKLTENKLQEVIYNQDSEYFLNYTELNIEDINIEGACIQHCDFAANNIHLDIEANKWGIIDWEGLSQGMPPMLDLFSMYTSFRFTVGKTNYKSFQEKYYDAIIDTYFSDNWISRCILMNLKKYCLEYKISEKRIYINFVLFLLFQCNKYRIFKSHEYQLIFEEMLRYTIENKEKFITRISINN